MIAIKKVGVSVAVATTVMLSTVACGHEASQAGSIKDSPSTASATPSDQSTSGTDTTSSPSAEATESASAASVSSAAPAASVQNVEKVQAELTKAANGSLGPVAFNDVQANLYALGMKGDASMRDVYSATTQSRITVVQSVGEPRVTHQGESVVMDYTVVEGHATYEPGESEADGADRAAAKLKTYVQNNPDAETKHLVFTVKPSKNINPGTVSASIK